MSYQTGKETRGLCTHALNSTERIDGKLGGLICDEEQSHVRDLESSNGYRVRRASKGESVISTYDGVDTNACGKGNAAGASAVDKGGAAGRVELGLVAAPTEGT